MSRPESRNYREEEDMKINALLMDPSDNVVTCVEEVAAGQEVVYRSGDEFLTVTAAETIPYCHKAALRDFEAEEAVIKYGELIGNTTRPVKKGGWVSHENIYSGPRDYDSEMV